MSDKRYVRGWGNLWKNRLPRAHKHLHAALQALSDDDGKLAVDPELTIAQRDLKHTIEWHITKAQTGIDMLQNEATLYGSIQESQTKD
jgi:hypothetical protein